VRPARQSGHRWAAELALSVRGLLEAGHPEQALPELKAAAQFDPDFRRTHQDLEELYIQIKQPEEAMREFQLETRIYRTALPDFQRLGPPPRNQLRH